MFCVKGYNNFDQEFFKEVFVVYTKNLAPRRQTPRKYGVQNMITKTVWQGIGGCTASSLWIEIQKIRYIYTNESPKDAFLVILKR